jgi:nitroreductase
MSERIQLSTGASEWTPIGAIAIGYPDPGADPVPPARASDRRSLNELVHLGRW